MLPILMLSPQKPVLPLWNTYVHGLHAVSPQQKQRQTELVFLADTRLVKKKLEVVRSVLKISKHFPGSGKGEMKRCFN